MIQVMEYSEKTKIMELWQESMLSQGIQEKDQQNYFKEVEESLDHSNVYVYHKNNEITGFITIIEGFYIADLIGKNHIIFKELLDHVQESYDELQISIPDTSKLKKYLDDANFREFGKSIHEVFKCPLIDYEWLLKE